MTATPICKKCGKPVLEGQRTDRHPSRPSHANSAVCNSVPRSAPSTSGATLATVRQSYAQQYATTASRGTCRSCGGPVSDGRSTCGEC